MHGQQNVKFCTIIFFGDWCFGDYNAVTYVAKIGNERNEYWNLIGKYLGKLPFERLKIWEDTIRLGLAGTYFGSFNLLEPELFFKI